MKIDLIAGARPNFMKVAPIFEALETEREAGADFEVRLIHTGQHYDKNLSETFFEELGLPHPTVNFDARGGSHAEQTGRIMLAYEQWLQKSKTDLCLVVGDVNSTLACAVSAKKAQVCLAHVEAGLRSGDMSMPEEVNRIAVDSLSDLFFTTTLQAGERLRNNGVADAKIHFVGNTMIDTLRKQIPHFSKPAVWDELGLQGGAFIVVTLHRPSNVDDGKRLSEILNQIAAGSRGKPVLFPVHPRTAEVLKKTGFAHPAIHLLPPLPYREFNYLVSQAQAVLTDSGGITEETTVLGIPCITLRENTERPETVEIGTNVLAGLDPANIEALLDRVFEGKWAKGEIPERWDGQAGFRIAAVLKELLNS